MSHRLNKIQLFLTSQQQNTADLQQERKTVRRKRRTEWLDWAQEHYVGSAAAANGSTT
jgi:hypothetical protein